MAGYLRNPEVVYRQYDWSEIPPSVAIVKTIEHYEDENESGQTSGLDEPLYHYFDADAVNTLVRDDSPVTITLSIGDYHAEIDDHTIRITPGRLSPQPSQ